jgi:hypothetical protein
LELLINLGCNLRVLSFEFRQLGVAATVTCKREKFKQ